MPRGVSQQVLEHRLASLGQSQRHGEHVPEIRTVTEATI
jgi:hypothetical protein